MLPPDELLRRFRVGLDTPAVIDGPRSLDALISAFARSVESKDRASLEKLLVTKAEFAWLVFPELRISKNPYRQPPEIAWLLQSAATGGGMSKLVARNFEFHGHFCSDAPAIEGDVRLWRCTVRVTQDGREREARLFSPIVERQGRFKFLGYDTDL